MEKKLNQKKLFATIEKSKNGELFHALFYNDLERANNNLRLALKSCLSTLAWYLNNDIIAVTEVIKDAPLVINNNVDLSLLAQLINNACSNSNAFAGFEQFFNDDNEEQYTLKTRTKKSETLKINTVEEWLVEHGVSVAFNLMTQQPELTGYKDRLLQAGNLFNTLPTVICDDLQDNYKGCSSDKIAQILAVIVESRPYHPVLDLLNSIEWDKCDRLEEFFKLINIADDTEYNKFSRVLFVKWFKQTLAMLHNGENGQTFGAEGVLTLNGVQGIGKTTLLRKLAINRAFFREGQRLDDKDKDTARRCVTTWIAELGELDCTLKSDLGYLKAFITADTDSYRLPYGRADINNPRRASLSASVNGDSYLVDPTGNRRFWTIELKHIDLDGLEKFDFLQLWKQIETMIIESGEKWSSCFRLTRLEMSKLEERNNCVKRGLKGENEISEILLTAPHEATWEYMTVARFKNCFDVLRSYSSEQIGRVLKALNCESKQKRINGMPVKVYKLPSTTTVSVPILDNRDIKKYSINEDEDIPF